MSGGDAAVLPPVETRRDARPARGVRGARPRTGLRGRWVAALAVVLLLTGALLATVARPAREARATVPTAGSAPLLVLDASVLGGLDGRDGAVAVRATGSGPVLVATGTAADVSAWADGAATTTVTAADTAGSLTASTSQGEAQVPDPAGSDLWTAQATGTGSAELTTELTTELSTELTTGAPLAVLVAADGATPAPTAVELVWTERPVPLVAWVLLGAGALLGLLAGRRPPRREPVVVVLPVTGPVAARSPGPRPPVREASADADDTEPVLLRRPRGSDRRSPR